MGGDAGSRAALDSDVLQVCFWFLRIEYRHVTWERMIDAGDPERQDSIEIETETEAKKRKDD
jgi:hypothetical protein